MAGAGAGGDGERGAYLAISTATGAVVFWCLGQCVGCAGVCGTGVSVQLVSLARGETAISDR